MKEFIISIRNKIDNNVCGIVIRSLGLWALMFIIFMYILNNDILTCNKAKVSKYIVKELDVLLKRYLNQYIDNRGFKSLNLIESIENKKGAE